MLTTEPAARYTRVTQPTASVRRPLNVFGHATHASARFRRPGGSIRDRRGPWRLGETQPGHWPTSTARAGWRRRSLLSGLGCRTRSRELLTRPRAPIPSGRPLTMAGWCGRFGATEATQTGGSRSSSPSTTTSRATWALALVVAAKPTVVQSSLDLLHSVVTTLPDTRLRALVSGSARIGATGFLRRRGHGRARGS